MKFECCCILKELKAGVDLDCLPPGKIGGFNSPSLAVLQWTESAWNVNHSDKIKNLVQLQELYFLITPKIIFSKTTKTGYIMHSIGCYLNLRPVLWDDTTGRGGGLDIWEFWKIQVVYKYRFVSLCRLPALAEATYRDHFCRLASYCVVVGVVGVTKKLCHISLGNNTGQLPDIWHRASVW